MRSLLYSIMTELLKAISNPRIVNQSLMVDYTALKRNNPDLAAKLVESATNYYDAEDYHQPYLSQQFGPNKYRIRVFNMPDTVTISQLMQRSYENQIVQFSGIVTYLDSVRKMATYKLFKCMSCGITKKEYDARRIDVIKEDMPKGTSRTGYCPVCCKKF